MQRCGAGHVQEGFIQRQWFNGRGELLHHFSDGRTGFYIFIHARPHDHRFGAEFQCLKHRHRRFYTAHPGHIASRADHPAPTAANDDRFAGQFWIVALFDGGIEGIAIHMGDGEGEQLWIGSYAWSPATRTSVRGGIKGG